MRTITKTETSIGIESKDCEAISESLNRLLADEFALYVKTRNFHWNVTGPNFAGLHKLFETQYEELNEVIDEAAERIRVLGRKPAGSLREYLAKTRLREDAGKELGCDEMLRALLGDHERVIGTLRADLEACLNRGDAGTCDFLTGLLQRHEKTAWMLRSHLA